MKKSGLITLICSMILIIVLALAAVFAMIFTGVVSAEREKLVISSSSAMAVYNGEPLTDRGWHLVEGNLKTGHSLSVNVSGSQTGVGISENYISAKVLDKNGADVSGDYAIEYRPGALNVKPRAMTVIAASKMKTFDNTPLTCDDYELESAISLVDGDSMLVDIEGEITDPGETANVIKSVVITNKKGSDVTRNYDISTVDGKLIVYTEQTIVISTDNGSKYYDGEELVNPNWFLDSGIIKDGDKLTVDVTGSQTVAGTSENTAKVRIVNSEGNDVTKNYQIITNPGNLTVIKRDITITSGSATQVYDPKNPLRCDEYTCDPAFIESDGFIIDLKITGVQTLVGKSENTIASCSIYNADEEDVTKNFNITLKAGILEVTETLQAKIPLSITTLSDEKVYDGEALSNVNWNFEGELDSDHHLDVKVTGELTNAGKADNTVEVKVLDAAGKDVSELYDIKRNIGTLTVKPAELIITAGSADKRYDGDPLTSDEFLLTNAYYTENFEFEVITSGQQTNVGSMQNDVSSVNVYLKDKNGEIQRDEDGNIQNEKVTQNFKITREIGTLEVLEPEEELKIPLVYKSGSATKVYDGTPLDCKDFFLISGDLKEGHKAAVDISSTITNVGRIENVVSVTIYEEESGINVSALYDIKYETGTLTVTKRPITITSASDSKRYDGTPLTAPGYEYEPQDALLYGHGLMVTISGSAVNVTGPAGIPNTISGCKIITEIDGNKVDVTGNYEITKNEGTLRVDSKPEIVISTKEGKKEYDGTPLTVDNWTSSGELLPGHHLEVKVTGERIDCGTSDNTATADIVDSNGISVLDSYKLKYNFGTLTVTEKKITITAGSAQKLYDGEPLMSSEYIVSPSYLTDEFDFYVVCDGEQTEVGKSANTVSDYIIEKDGEDVTDNFDVTLEDGVLKVVATPEELLIEITFKSGSDSREYNGKPLSCEEYEIVSGSLETGHKVGNVEYLKSITDVGTEENTFVVTIVDKATGEDVTELYNIKYEPGTLKVTEREITIKSNSDSKMYDGTPLKNAGYTYDKDKLVSGHWIVAEITGAALEVTEGVPNTIQSCRIMTMIDGEEVDVSSNYKIIKEEGTLKITPNTKPRLVIFTQDGEAVYNGEVFKCEKSSYEGAIDPNHNIDIVVTGEGIIPGSYENTATVTIRDADGTEVTDSYNIEYVFGTLEISKCPITIKAGSDEKVYDGTPLTTNEYTLTPAYIKEIFEFVITCQGSQTVVGSSKNEIATYEIFKDGDLVTDYFEVTPEDGTLKVVESEEELKPDLVFSSGSKKREYNGKELTLESYELVEGELMDGHKIAKVEYYGCIEADELGITENAFKVWISDSATGEDVSSQYDIIYKPGTLEVTKAEITIKSNDASKTYDGEELSDSGFTYDADKLASGHKIDAVITGKVTDVTGDGGVPNTVKSVSITDKDGNPVDDFYNVTVEEGRLVVNPEIPEVPALDMSGSLKGNGANQQDAVFFTVKTTTGETIYLKMQSYGDYNGTGWDTAPDYSEMLTPGKSAYYLTGESLSYSYVDTVSATIDPVAGYYALPYYTDMKSGVAQSSDVKITGNVKGKYTVSYYSESGVLEGMILPSEYQAFEQYYKNHVTSTYLEVDDETRQYILDNIVDQLNIPSNAGIATKVNAVVSYLKQYTYNLNYDAGLDDEDNIVVSFLSDYQVGVCRHFASAATLILRTIGVPARYTVGFAAPTTKNAETTITGEYAHAWVEVYNEGSGWYNIETTPARSNPSQGSKEPVTFTVKPVKLSAQYPKTSTLKHSGSISGFPTSLTDLGYTYTAEVEGEISELGYGSAKITNFIIKDAGGNEVYNKATGYGSDIFKVSYETVSDALHLYLDKLTFKSVSKSQTYNGNALETLHADITQTNSVTLQDGYSLEIIPTGKRTDAGTSTASFTVKIWKDGVDCTSHYNITKSEGTLTVNARNITIQAASDTRQYNGSALTCNSYEIISGSLANGDKETVVITGSVTKPGEASNVISSVTIKREGVDVTKNYNITTIEGLLVVTP